MTTLERIAGKIIKEQELIVGPLAWEEAGHVEGLRIIYKKRGEVSIEENVDRRAVIDDLVREYEALFGRAALEVCKDAVVGLLADLQLSEVPSSLQ